MLPPLLVLVAGGNSAEDIGGEFVKITGRLLLSGFEINPLSSRLHLTPFSKYSSELFFASSGGGLGTRGEPPLFIGAKLGSEIELLGECCVGRDVDRFRVLVPTTN